MSKKGEGIEQDIKEHFSIRRKEKNEDEAIFEGVIADNLLQFIKDIKQQSEKVK